jgi:hypothetical protein
MPALFPNPPQDFSVLVQPSSTAIVLQVIVNSLVAMGIRADLWPKEGAAYSCMNAVAAIFAAFINVTVIPAIKSGLLPTSAGNWLTWLALYMYGVSKILATFGTGQITLTNNGGGNFAIPAFGAIFKNQYTGATYTNTVAIALAPGPGTTQTLSIQATMAGASSNANPSDISGANAIASPQMANVTANNLVSVVGTNDQTDESLRLACWNSIAANSAYGPRSSYGYAIQTALNSVTSAPVNINRYQLLGGSGAGSHTGQLILGLASPAGAPDPNDVTGVANNIEGIARAPGTQITVLAAGTVPDTDTLTVYVAKAPTLLSSTIQAAIQAALATFFSSPTANPIGGVTVLGQNGIFGEAVAAVCNAAWPPRPTDPTVQWQSGVLKVTGANDYILTAGQVLTNSTQVVVVLV